MGIVREIVGAGQAVARAEGPAGRGFLQGASQAAGRAGVTRADSAAAAGARLTPKDFFTPQALSDAWSGVFGSQGLRAEVVKVRIRGRRGHGLLGSGITAHIKGVVRTPEGHKAGRFERKVRLEPGGHLHVDHQYLALAKRVRGTGFARGFNDHAEQAYKRYGVREINMLAALDDGGYVWARAGYDFRLPRLVPGMLESTARRQLVLALTGEAVASGRISFGQAREVMASGASSPADIVALGDLGERTLRGSTWPARKALA